MGAGKQNRKENAEKKISHKNTKQRKFFPDFLRDFVAS